MEAIFLACGAGGPQLKRNPLGGGTPMSKQEPRELPPSSSFSSPHIQCLAGARYFLNLLEEQTATAGSRALQLRAAQQNEDLAWIEGALERQALSEAVQVFAAMTAEGAVNLLGILMLGQDEFYGSLEKQPLKQKLSKLLEIQGSTDDAVRNELLAFAGSLSQPRNSYVHPKPMEGAQQAREGRGPSLRDARQAVEEAVQFLALLQKVSYRYRPFFHVWQ